METTKQSPRLHLLADALVPTRSQSRKYYNQVSSGSLSENGDDDVVASPRFESERRASSSFDQRFEEELETNLDSLNLRGSILDDLRQSDEDERSLEEILGGPYESERQASEPVSTNDSVPDSGVIHLKYAIVREHDDKPSSRKRVLLKLFKKRSPKAVSWTQARHKLRTALPAFLRRSSKPIAEVDAEQSSEDQVLLVERNDDVEGHKAAFRKIIGIPRIPSPAFLRRNNEQIDQVGRGDRNSDAIRDVTEVFSEDPKSEQGTDRNVSEIIAPEIWTTLSAVPEFLLNPTNLAWTDGDKNAETVEAGKEESSEDSTSEEEPGNASSHTRRKVMPTILQRYYKTFARADGVDRKLDGGGAVTEKANEESAIFEQTIDSKVEKAGTSTRRTQSPIPNLAFLHRNNKSIVRADRCEKKPNPLRIWAGKKPSENLVSGDGVDLSVPKSSPTKVLVPRACSTEMDRVVEEDKNSNDVDPRSENNIHSPALVPLSREQSKGNRLGFRIRSFRRTEKATTPRAKDDATHDIISLHNDDLSLYSSVSGSGTLSVGQRLFLCRTSISILQFLTPCLKH